MSSDYEWAIAHINQEGIEVGSWKYDSEEAARSDHASCVGAGMPCRLLRRPVSVWQEVPA